MDLELLRGPLAVSDNPGLGTTDPRMSEIASMVQEGNYLEAANRSQEILAEQAFDIRIIGYFLYGHFAEYGLPAIGDIFLCLDDLICNNLEALGPVKNKPKHIKNTLAWLSRIVLNNLDYEEGRRSRTYDDWQASLSRDHLEEMIGAVDQLGRTIMTSLEDGKEIAEGLGKIKQWLYSFQGTLSSSQPEEDQKEAPEELPEREEIERVEEDHVVARPKTSVTEEPIAGLEGSYHMKQLIIKLDAFDRLLSSGKLVSAAIVADDINGIIANFDPKLYLPGLFVKYTIQMAQNINSLVAYTQYRQSSAWMALQELYKVDIESFIEFDVDGLDFAGEAPYGEPSYSEGPPREDDL